MYRLLFIIAVLLASCSTRYKGIGHMCKWQLCPYHGVTANNARAAVIAYTGESDTDAYCIDMLHLQYPSDDYEQLEERLFNNNKSNSLCK